MNKKELAKVYIKMSKERINIKEVLKEIDIFTKTVEEALLIKGYIKFIKRGTFMVLKKKPRTVSNPSTKELMRIYPRKTVKFKISKKLTG
ncbi:MAG: HU family DNA-binding protein [Fusobacterium varium]|nr:HU family DNA-binding protein [Fusobacterium varium]